METLVKRISDDLSIGRFKARLKDYCLRWRTIKSAYAVEYVISHLTDQHDSRNLFVVLSDPDFRSLKVEHFGINALRADLQKGLNYFSQVEPNLMSYLQVLFLQQPEGPETSRAFQTSQNYCQQYSDFLQLDVHPKRRQKIGIQAVLSEIFPFTLRSRGNASDGKVTDRAPRSIHVDFVDYELGSWFCECKGTFGQLRRFDYSCGCGKTRGNGALEQPEVICGNCEASPTYSRCPSCGTRVSLDQIWLIQAGQLHPCQLKLPLFINLITTESDVRKELRLKLLDFPGLLGLREHKGQIFFEPPDLFWLESAPADDFIPKGLGTQMVAFQAGIRNLRELLERVLKHALTLKTSNSLKTRLRPLIFKGSDVEISSVVSKRFNDILSLPNNGITRTIIHHSELTGAMDLSIDCTVAATDSVEPGSVVVNRRLLERGSLQSPSLINFATVLKRRGYGDDTLARFPFQESRTDALEADGIGRVGASVQPFDTLVGIESRVPTSELGAAARLLSLIFGEDSEHSKKNNSLHFKSSYPGTILGVNIIASKKWSRLVAGAPGRFISFDEAGYLLKDELARINVAVAVEQPIEVGDTLYTEDGTEAVICEFIGGAALAKLAQSSEIPDVLVHTAHPWAQAGHGSEFHRVRVKVKNDSMLSANAKVRSVGLYGHIRSQPSTQSYDPDAAQELHAEDFDWLLACNALNTASEFAGPRYDCPDWRNRAYKALVNKRFRLLDLYSQSNTQTEEEEKTFVEELNPGLVYPADDLECPSETIRFFDRLLRGISIRMTLSRNDSLDKKLGFSLVNDSAADSYGEVTVPHSVQAQARQPLRAGLFCEVIFGPVKNFRCSCGKYKRAKGKRTICDQCGVDVVSALVRRQRMGHIPLGAPVINPFFISSLCFQLGAALKVPVSEIKALAYFARTLVIDDNVSGDGKYSVVTHEEAYSLLRRKSQDIRLLRGADAFKELLHIHLNKLKPKSPYWQDVITKTIAVLPPERRPVFETSDGGVVISGANHHYNRLIERNQRLRKLESLRAPRVIIEEAQQLLQHGVDQLFNQKLSEKPPMRDVDGVVQSLADTITSFANQRATLIDGLLNRPVDFSAITRLVTTDETPEIDTALVPERFLTELLQPLVLGQLERMGIPTLMLARDQIIERTELARKALLEVIQDALILISPSLSAWRLIAVRPIVSHNLAVGIHPKLLEQIGEHNLGKPVKLFSVLSEEAIREAREKLTPSQLPNTKSLTRALAKRKKEKSKSPFNIAKNDILSELTQRALVHTSHDLTTYDRLILGLPPET